MRERERDQQEWNINDFDYRITLKTKLDSVRPP